MAQAQPSEHDADASVPSSARHSATQELDRLVARLCRSAEAGDLDDGRAALRLVAAAVGRLRADVMRSAIVRLEAAEAEAREILDDARAHAEAMRAAGLAALRRRVDESERLLCADDQAEPVAARGRLRLAEVPDHVG